MKGNGVTVPQLEFEIAGARRTETIETLIIAGWTGRDRAAVEHHIAELAAIGVRPPRVVPCFCCRRAIWWRAVLDPRAFCPPGPRCYTVDMGRDWEVPPGYPPEIEQQILAGFLDESRRTGFRTRPLRYARSVNDETVRPRVLGEGLKGDRNA